MAFDLDGTILFADGISTADAAAIARWQAAGNLAVCATGKSISAARYALQDTPVRFDYYVLNTGCVITDAALEPIWTQPLDAAVVRALDAHFTGAAGVNVYATTLSSRDVILHEGVATKETTILIDAVGFDPAMLETHQFVGVPIWIPNDPDLLNTTRDWICAHLPQAGVVQNQDFLDVIPAGSDKGAGLARLTELLGKSPRTFSIGDSFNDVGMHRWAGRSACFSYSPAEVKAACDVVVGSAAEFIAAALDDAPAG
ncbi:hypothetical protein CATYP_02440 [Corynebacterium atypicum]|uniref:Hydrolase n=2 Tax=Corynebacterium atypicum TaxID=191610 RepID=A0ABN4DBG8_9CORY|nr:hypothetical protein CATYP_02440 [Corynebacterium atypicum]